jgi:hypothetical protein
MVTFVVEHVLCTCYTQEDFSVFGISGSHSGENLGYSLVGYDAVLSCKWLPTCQETVASSTV